jgi:uncharacterized protein (TIGR01777 family)
MKSVLITGASGLIGKELVRKLKDKGYQVRTLSRHKSEHNFYWNPKEGNIEETAFENLNAIIHLAGASISKRWTKTYKKEIYDSRIQTANLLYEYAKRLNIPLKTFITASGTNYYGTQTTSQIFQENELPGDDFLAKVCYEWEISAAQFENLGARICSVRTSAVLSNKGGMLRELNPLAKLYLLSPLGSGKQILPWIHIEDMLNIYIHLLENEHLSGAFNAATSDVVNNSDFTKTLMKMKGRKVVLPAVPSFVLKLALGEMSSILLEGTAISNEKIKATGFQFQYETLKNALENLEK